MMEGCEVLAANFFTGEAWTVIPARKISHMYIILNSL
jgi:hypothetical protein